MYCYWQRLESPIGPVYLAATDEGLVYCGTPRETEGRLQDWVEKYLPEYELLEATNSILDEAMAQLTAYFKGESPRLDVPLKLVGTPFRVKVWQALTTIPFGETRTYGQIAAQVGNPKGPRAVGQANHHNPVSFFVP